MYTTGLLPWKTRHTVNLVSLCFSLYKCTRFDIITVLYTCTTVASRVAANARALTHARRSLRHRRLTHHTHTSTHLNVPNLGVLNPWSICTPGLLCSNLDPSPKARRPFEPVKGRWTKSSRFRPDRHPVVNSHKQSSRTWRLKPTGFPAGDYPHTPVPLPWTSHTRRG